MYTRPPISLKTSLPNSSSFAPSQLAMISAHLLLNRRLPRRFIHGLSNYWQTLTILNDSGATEPHLSKALAALIHRTWKGRFSLTRGLPTFRGCAVLKLVRCNAD